MSPQFKLTSGHTLENKHGVETNFRLETVHFIFTGYITARIAQWQQTDMWEEWQYLWVVEFYLFDPVPSELGQDSNQNRDTLVKCENDPRVSDVNFA